MKKETNNFFFNNFLYHFHIFHENDVKGLFEFLVSITHNSKLVGLTTE